MEILIWIILYFIGFILSYLKWLGSTAGLQPYYTGFWNSFFADGAFGLWVSLVSWVGFIMQVVVYFSMKDTLPYFFKTSWKDRR